jgi:hypothetical protein
LFHLIFLQAKEILVEESNIPNMSSPVKVCGDIHGQYFDLLELFKIGGDIPNTKYIFMGDYVDRGYNSIETFLLLILYKIKYPGNVILIRGNHESRQITITYGFYEEIIKKYGNANPWRYFTDVFDYLPIGAVIDNKVLCIHGGLSPTISTIDQMKLLNRKVEIPTTGVLCGIIKF